ETGGLEPCFVFGFREGAGDAADVAAADCPLSRGEVVFGDDVADPDPAARLEHAGDLRQHGRLVRGEVDHAVGDDDVDRGGGERDRFDHALEEDRVADAGFGRVPA